MITMSPKSTNVANESTSVEVNGVDHTGSLTADDVVLLNSSSVSVKGHYIFTMFKGTVFDSLSAASLPPMSKL
jgi:hypothetical protein